MKKDEIDELEELEDENILDNEEMEDDIRKLARDGKVTTQKHED